MASTSPLEASTSTTAPRPPVQGPLGQPLEHPVQGELDVPAPRGAVEEGCPRRSPQTERPASPRRTPVKGGLYPPGPVPQAGVAHDGRGRRFRIGAGDPAVRATVTSARGAPLRSRIRPRTMRCSYSTRRGLSSRATSQSARSTDQ
jgi:hypothetical protein